MKIYISADMEGICGTTDWDDVTRGKEEYPEFQKQMTAEVSAACQGAFAAGATEIVVRDAHDTARNLIASELPEGTLLVKGWSRHPYMMMQELDNSFDGILMIGHHSHAGGAGNPLSHTMRSQKITQVTINDEIAGEFLLNSFTAMYEKVPVVYISGDGEICDYSKKIFPNITSVAVKHGNGSSTINIHPKTAIKRIAQSVEEALTGDLFLCLQELPVYFQTTVTYAHAKDAYKASFFPKAKLISPRKVSFESDDYFDLLTFFVFNL